jgi:hypothetical protein
LQTRDPISGEWSSQRAQGIRNGANFEVLTQDQLNKLQGPLTTPITPPQPSGPPPLPGWVDNNRPNPGYTAAPAGPTTLVNPAAPQPTAAELMIDRRNSEILGGNLEASGKTRPEGFEAHHIVPSRAGDARMEALRQRLEGLGLKLNDAVNGVWLPGADAPEGAQEAYHPRLNNRLYNEAVIAAFRGVTTLAEAQDILARIGSQLQQGGNAFPGIRPRGD